MMNINSVLCCKKLVKDFDRTRAVDNLDLEVPAGAIFGLLGPNGSGKTTTIRACLGIYVPDAGSVELLGSSKPLSVRDRVGYLPEERGLYAKMKVQEQLAFLASIRGLDMKEAHRRAGEWLDRLELGDRKQSQTNELSKGMQQKVQFASAVIHDPELIVLDEPFTGLDPVNSRLLKDLIKERQEKGATVILSTHRMEQVEALCESICLIHEGRTVLTGKLAEIKASYGRSRVSLEYSGEPSQLEGLPGVLEMNHSEKRVRFRLQPGADTQHLLRTLVERVEVHSFRVEEPHMEEIYLEKVGQVKGGKSVSGQSDLSPAGVAS